MAAGDVVGEDLQLRLVVMAASSESSRPRHSILPSVFCACGGTTILPWNTPVRLVGEDIFEGLAADAGRRVMRQGQRRVGMLAPAQQARAGEMDFGVFAGAGCEKLPAQERRAGDERSRAQSRVLRRAARRRSAPRPPPPLERAAGVIEFRAAPERHEQARCRRNPRRPRRASPAAWRARRRRARRDGARSGLARRVAPSKRDEFQRRVERAPPARFRCTKPPSREGAR